jgi:uncharacterized protein (TIGR02391 family)
VEIIMEHAELTERQRLYLQFILNYLREYTRWPTYHQLDQYFNQAHPNMDIEDIWESLPSDLTSYLNLNNLDDQAKISIYGIYMLEPKAPEFALFLQILKLCVDTYFASENPTIGSEEILRYHPTWREKGVYRTGLLLLDEPNIHRQFTGPTPSGQWNCTLAREIRRFRGITTIEEYLEKQGLPRQIVSPSTTPSTSDVGISIPVQSVWLHPTIYTGCWNSYTQGDYDNAIFNATKAIEVAVRSKAKLPDDLVGASLIARAFKPDSPILTYSAIGAEQEGMMSLLRGIIQVYKNPQSHRHIGAQDKSECLGILLMCSSLLYTIDTLQMISKP